MNQINLLPEEVIKERFRRRMDLTLVLLFAIVMISVILAERISSRNFDVVTQTHVREEGQFAQVDRSSSEFFGLLSKRSSYMSEVKKAMELEQKVPRSYLLAVITNACPNELSLEKVLFSLNEKLSEERKGKTVMTTASTAAPVNPEDNMEDIIDIYGVAATDGDVTDFVAKLRSNPVFSEVNLIQTKEWSSVMSRKAAAGQKLFSPSREFSVTLKVNPDVDVQKLIRREPEKTEKKAEGKGGEK